MDGLTLDYPLLSAFAGLQGDYSKAAAAIHVLAGWDTQALLVQWAISYVLVPVTAFSMTYWGLRVLRLRHLPRGHLVRMLCNLDWARPALRSRGSSSGGQVDEGDAEPEGKPATSHIKVFFLSPHQDIPELCLSVFVSQLCVDD